MSLVIASRKLPLHRVRWVCASLGWSFAHQCSTTRIHVAPPNRWAILVTCKLCSSRFIVVTCSCSALPYFFQIHVIVYCKQIINWENFFCWNRSLSKRKASEGPLQCVTVAKRPRRSSISLLSTSPGEISTSHSNPSSLDSSLMHDLVNSCCCQVHSAIMACTLAGPSVQAILNASLVSMLAVLHFTLSQAFGSANQPSTSIIPASPPTHALSLSLK